MSGELAGFGYQVQERGSRTAPSKFHRNFRCLTALLDRFQRIIDSDLLSQGQSILDYGCGNQPYASLFKKKFKHYVSADIVGNNDASLVLDPDGRLPTKDQSFDCVLSSQVLEHVVSPEVYLDEAFRVLRTGGSLILSTHGIWPYHPDPCDFWRWTLDGLQVQIRQAGFEILKVQSVFGLESSALQLWQDATFERLPRLLQPVYTGFFQLMIGLLERRHTDKISNDAAVYIVLARKPH